MMSSFDRAFDYMLENEGGYGNTPGDKGGATKYGITIATLSRWRGYSVSIKEVSEMSLAEAKEIYYEWYWMANDLLDVGSDAISTALFDIGVVRGLSVPIMYAQDIVGVPHDGHNGPVTLKALNAYDPDLFIEHFALRAENGFRAIARRNPTQEKFLNGWVKRAKRLRTLKTL